MCIAWCPEKNRQEIDSRAPLVTQVPCIVFKFLIFIPIDDQKHLLISFLNNVLSKSLLMTKSSNQTYSLHLYSACYALGLDLYSFIQSLRQTWELRAITCSLVLHE